MAGCQGEIQADVVGLPVGHPAAGPDDVGFEWHLRTSTPSGFRWIPYPIFVYSGLLFWGIFSSGLNGAANSMVTNSNLIKKIYFPRLILPMSSVLVAVFDFLMALLVYFFLLFYFGQTPSVGRMLWCLPLGLVLTVITTFGLGSMLAAWNVKYRDFRYIIPFLIQFLLFVNPIIYSTSIFRGTWAEYLIAANPMAGAIDLSRYAFLDQAIRYDLLGISFASAILLFIGGIYFFRKSEAYFADIV
ncbi:MAG: ABC transporter permease [Bacteroidota bacterium]